MKKAIIALSAILVAAPVFAATTHATDDTVAAAHEQANTAKEKLHQAQNEGDELKLKSEHAAQGKSDSVGSQVSEGAQKTWNKTKEGTEKGWDKTKEGTEKGWNKTKAATEKGWDATKDGAAKGWDDTKKGAEDLKNKVTE
ncbi:MULTISPECIES: hypothetical protein [Enterobacteriaceae]|uniref:Uncharacterized protein n=1 Tax=Raoultella lignicola TaxID=3040939 RepID=A0ABU9FFE9_9ENTR|nr:MULTISPECIES: hypothetical protein [Enterobacteriaceae]MRT47801.1 hypothetical protein [Raoultella sp. RIT712]QNK10280.1 hypothetical protein HF679_12310 [Enterobacter sp. JUb54]ROS13649.1 hypothetical protein EDF82_2468 [Raoultella sp. BIGb0399]